MRHSKIATWLLVLGATTVVACEKKTEPTPEPAPKAEPRPVEPDESDESTERAEPQPAESRQPPVPTGVSCFSEAYPDHVTEVSRQDDDVIVHVGDLRLRWDDGHAKSFDEKLADPDLEDTVSIPYPVGEPNDAPEENEDPGRIRHDDFLQHVYGGSESAVRDNLASVDWPGDRTIAFNEQNGAADALRAVAKELDALPDEYRKYFTKTAGTFNWRTISGTDRMSAHSYAVAIDLNVDYSNYWRWQDKSGENLEYRNRIPWEIVEIFERHGFVWGGKWYHYDTMHFEYRPELFESACSG
jgi:hypothetical protein